MGVSRKFQGPLKYVSSMIQWICKEYIKGISGESLRVFEASSIRVSKQFLGSFRRFIRKFQSVSKFFQECFKEVSRKCCEKFKDVFKEVLRCFKKVSRGSGKIQGCFKSVSRVIQEGFKSHIKEVSMGVSRGVERFHRSFKDISRKFFKCLIEFKGLVRVFKCCYVFKSLSMSITHRSYPSKRRACFLQSMPCGY